MKRYGENALEGVAPQGSRAELRPVRIGREGMLAQRLGYRKP
jgi:hypothetical protein